MLSDSDDQVCYLILMIKYVTWWSIDHFYHRSLLHWLVDWLICRQATGLKASLVRWARGEKRPHIYVYQQPLVYDQLWLWLPGVTSNHYESILAGEPPPSPMQYKLAEKLLLKKVVRWSAYMVLLTMIVLRNLAAIMMAIDSFSMSYVRLTT